MKEIYNAKKKQRISTLKRSLDHEINYSRYLEKLHNGEAAENSQSGNAVEKLVLHDGKNEVRNPRKYYKKYGVKESRYEKEFDYGFAM